MKTTPLPLAGITVLDVSTVLAAPVTATLLGDFGADVIKVEEPHCGDFTRAGTGSQGPGDRSLQWVQEGRNKRSVTLDLHTERGQELVKQLVSRVDVVVTNYRPPTLEKWGLDAETLLEINPNAVITCLTGYGLTGPYRDRGAFDRIASAFSGLTYTSGYPDGPPVRSGYSVIDFMAAYLAAFATVTALYHRDQNGGQGQIVDLALYEAGFRSSEDALLDFAWRGVTRERIGNTNRQIVPASDFDTVDGRRISLHAGTPSLFKRLVKVMGAPELLTDTRFATREARIKHQDDLYELIGTWARTLSANEITDCLNEAGVPASPIMSIADIAADPHFRERGTIVPVVDDDFGQLDMTAPLPRLSNTPGQIRSLGPALGKHNREVLMGMLGLTEEDLRELSAAGVISEPASPRANSEGARREQNLARVGLADNAHQES